MPTLSDVAELRRILDDVLTLAERDIRQIAARYGSLRPQAATQGLLNDVPAVVQTWGDVASTVSSDWYANVRVGQPGSFSPTTAPPAPVEQIAPMVRWAVGPLFEEAVDWDRALADLLSGSTRLVRQGSTDTIRGNSWRDPAAGAWVRVPRAKACAFCLMLASRGAVYRSAQTAGQDRGFHDNCRCMIAPAFDGEVFDINRKLGAEWKSVTAGERDQFAAWSKHIAASRVE